MVTGYIGAKTGRRGGRLAITSHRLGLDRFALIGSPHNNPLSENRNRGKPPMVTVTASRRWRAHTRTGAKRCKKCKLARTLPLDGAVGGSRGGRIGVGEGEEAVGGG